MLEAHRPNGRFFYGLVMALLVGWTLIEACPVVAADGAPATTHLSDIVYRADGNPASGTVLISWPAFTTTDSKPVAAGSMSVTLGPDGAFAADLVPNVGATPAGSYYLVVFQLDTVVRTEYWMVGTTSPTTISAVRATPGSGTATAPVSKQYVDNAIATNKAYVDSAVASVGAGSYVAKNGDAMNGPLTLPADPVSPLQAANKHYIDTALLSKANLVGGVVPPAQLGTGAPTGTVCLKGDSTWGACGGGSGNAIQLQGVDVANAAPVDSQVLAYNASAGKWQPTASGGSSANATQIQSLNVDSTPPAAGQMLVVTPAGTSYKPQTKTIYDLRDYVTTADGVTDNAAKIQNLLNAIGSAAVAIAPPPNTSVGSITFPKNVSLDFSAGGNLTPLTDSTAPGGGGYVRGAGSENQNSNSCSVTLTGTTAGDAIFFALKQYTSWSYSPGTPADGGDAFLKVEESTPGYPQYVVGWLAGNIAGGDRTITVPINGAVKNACIAFSIHGLGKYPRVVASTFSNSNPSSSTMSTGPLTIPAGSFVIAYGGQDYAAATGTAGSGFTLPSGTAGCVGTNQVLCAEYQASAAGGPVTATLSLSSAPSSYDFNLIALAPGSATVTILGGINNPQHNKIFDNALPGQGTIDFTGNLALSEVWPEWWGAASSASATTNTGALQSAILGAFGNQNRVNGSGLSQYNKPLRICQMFSINNELKFYHVNNFVIEGCGKLASGITQTGTNKRILDGQNVAYGTIHDLAFIGASSNTNALVDLDNDHTHGTDLSPQNIIFSSVVFAGSGVTDVGVLIAKHGSDAQGDNIRCEYCYFSGFTGAGWQVGGNNTGRNVGRNYAQNGIKQVIKYGDMQGNPLYGVAVYGGSIEVDGMSMENDTGGFGTQTGFDVYCEAPQDACVIQNVRSESHKLAAGQPMIIRNSRTIWQAAQWNSSNMAGTSWATNYCCISGTAIGGDGKYYKITTGGVFGGLNLTWATGGGSTTGLTVSGANWTPSAFVGYRATITANSGYGHYCIITANDATSLTCSGGWLTKFWRLPQATPDNTTGFFIEPNWGTQTTSGAVTFALLDFKVLDGAPAGGLIGAGSLIENVTVPGGQINIGGNGGGIMHQVAVSRADWNPNNAVLDTQGQATFRADQVGINTSALPGSVLTLNWRNYRIATGFARTNSGTDFRAPSYDQRGDGPIVWSIIGNDQTFVGAVKDTFIGGRSDFTANADPFRARLEYGGLLGPPAPDPSLGSNLNGAPARIGGGSSTGNGVPGPTEFWCGLVGASGSQINGGVPCWLIDAGTGHFRAGFDSVYDLGTVNSATITNVSENSASTVTLTVSGSTTTWSSSTGISIAGLTTATWLNGLNVLPSSGSATTVVFTDPTAHGSYSSAADTGTIKMGRPRDLNLGRNADIGGNLTVHGTCTGCSGVPVPPLTLSDSTPGQTALTVSAAGTNDTALAIPFGHGNILFNRLISTSLNAPTASIGFGPTDDVAYGCTACSVSPITGLATKQNLIRGNNSFGPAKVGDYQGISIYSSVFQGSTSGAVTVKGQAAAGTWILQLPTSGGVNGQCLQTDGTGITSWGACGTGGGGGGAGDFASITGAPTDNAALATALTAKADDSAVVHSTATNENILGLKTFANDTVFQGNVTIAGGLSLGGPWSVVSDIPTSPMTATAAKSTVGMDSDGKLKVSENGGAVTEVAKLSQITAATAGAVPTTTTVNGHALSSNVTVSASDLTTGTLPHAQLPTLLSGDIPDNAANTSGTAANLTAAALLPSGTTAATQAPGDSSTKVATTAYVDAAKSIPWVPFPGHTTQNAAPFPTGANTAWVLGFSLPVPISTTKVFYYVGTTADNTTNNYTIAIYNAAGTLQLHYTAAGSTFAYPAGTKKTATWTVDGSSTLPAGKYYAMFTSSCTASCATFTSHSVDLETFYNNSTFSVTTGGTAPASITAPTTGYEATSASSLSMIFLP